tara:strand:- start:756 stop:992 length:237 start_codon:yes stop_codon:yes gene_type:complete
VSPQEKSEVVSLKNSKVYSKGGVPIYKFKGEVEFELIGYEDWEMWIHDKSTATVKEKLTSIIRQIVIDKYGNSMSIRK